jgi:glutamine cyclotransferase
LQPKERYANTDVLNGIAYDAAGKKLYITGKKWPKLFQIALIKR